MVDARVGRVDVPTIVGQLVARHDLGARDVPVAVLAVVVAFRHARGGVGGENSRDDLPTLIDPTLIVLELLHGDGLFSRLAQAGG